MQSCNKWFLAMVIKNHWNISFLSSGWEEESVLNLLALLANTNVASVGDDKIIWSNDLEGKFIVTEFL